MIQSSTQTDKKINIFANGASSRCSLKSSLSTSSSSKYRRSRSLPFKLKKSNPFARGSTKALTNKENTCTDALMDKGESGRLMDMKDMMGCAAELTVTSQQDQHETCHIEVPQSISKVGTRIFGSARRL